VLYAARLRRAVQAWADLRRRRRGVSALTSRGFAAVCIKWLQVLVVDLFDLPPTHAQGRAR